MIPRKWWLHAGGAIIVLILAIVAYLHFNRPDPAVKRDIARSVTAENSYHAQEKASVKTDSAIAKIERTRKKDLAAAAVTEAVADTIGQGSMSERDSLAMWRLRDSAHVAEIASLRRVILSDSLEKDTLTADRNRWHAAADSLEAINASLRADVKKANGDCHLLPFVPCPSRKASFLAGIGAEFIIANQVRHPPKLKNAVVFAHMQSPANVYPMLVLPNR